jgi:hypothetical protein
LDKTRRTRPGPDGWNPTPEEKSTPQRVFMSFFARKGGMTSHETAPFRSRLRERKRRLRDRWHSLCDPTSQVSRIAELAKNGIQGSHGNHEMANNF